MVFIKVLKDWYTKPDKNIVDVKQWADSIKKEKRDDENWLDGRQNV